MFFIKTLSLKNIRGRGLKMGNYYSIAEKRAIDDFEL